MSKRIFLSLIILAAIGLWSGFYPPDQDKDIKKIEKYFKMDLHQLLKTEMTTAGKKSERIGDIPASVVLVTREEIETHGYQSLLEILESIPGLYATDDYAGLNLGVRGFWSYNPNRNMILLVNGIPYKDELTSTYPLEYIPVPVEAIDRIEVVRGPMSVIYGNGAIFGVVNIITNQPEELEPLNMVTASLGSEKTAKIFARSSGKGEDFQYVFNGTYFTTDGLNVPVEELGGPAFSGFTTQDKLERSEKFFNFSGIFKGFSFEASYSENRKEVMWLAPSLGDGSLSIFKNTSINIGYKKTFSDTLRLESKIGYFHQRMIWDVDMMVENFYGTQENGASGFKGELSLFIDPSPELGITLGVYYLNVMEVLNNYSYPFFGLNHVHHNLAKGESMVTQSFFAQINYTLSDQLQLVAGAMAEQTPAYTMEERIGHPILGISTSTFATYSHTKVEFIPRAAVIYSPGENHIFKFLYGEAFNRPSFFHNLDLFIGLGTPALEPETIRTFEVNYIGHLSSRLTLSLSVFRNILDKLLYRVFFTSGGVIITYHDNLGEIATNGVELTLQSEPFNNLRLELSGTFHDTKDRREGFEDIEVGYSPKFLGYFKASYFFSKSISLAAAVNYVDEMESLYNEATQSRLGEKVDGYFLVGANLRLRNLFGTGMFVNLRCSNLLDEDIRYPATANNNSFASLGTLGRGRSFLLTIGWKF